MIIRVEHRATFVVVDRETVRDERLSYRALGLLTFLLSHPDDWRVDSKQLANERPEGRDAVRSSLRELETFGYLVRTKVHEGGRLRTVSNVHERPIQEPGNPAPVIRQGPEKQAPEKQAPGNQAPLERVWTEECELPNNAASLDLVTPPTPGPTFAEFWELYPARNGRKVEKAKAVERWGKLSGPDRALAMRAVKVYAAACRREETIAKDAFRWLRDRSFEDWLEPAKAEGRRYPQPPDHAGPRCEHGYPLVETEDGWFSPCPKCDDPIALERQAAAWRRENAS